MPASKPYHLLEISLMSAQDLEPLSKKMKTYANVWIHSKRKLSTRMDTHGGANPTWNDKFVFRVDEEFLRNDNSAVMIEIYSPQWFRDALVGTVRVLMGNLVPPPRPFHNYYNGGMRCVALQVRRPSGRPQGIINIGATVLDSSMRSMPLYSGASAVGYRDLMAVGDDDANHSPKHHYYNQNQKDKNNEQSTFHPILLRSRSEKSTMFDNISRANSSLVAVPLKPTSSIVSGSNLVGLNCKKGKASSVISGAELQERPKQKEKKMKSSSLIGVPVFSKDSRTKSTNEKPGPEPVAKSNTKSGTTKPATKPNGFRVPQKPNSIWSESEVGPSPSEVAMAIMERRYPLDDEQSSILSGWSLNDSEEGLRSKLERWRTEVTPVYDRGSSMSSFRTISRHKRRHTDGEGLGLFSCFGNICGIECQCVCGKPDGVMERGSGYYSP